MGRGERVEAWLAAGGVVLGASERAARSIAAEFHEARRAEGRSAWATPAIYSWDGWVRERWQERNASGLMLLNEVQERVLWKRAIEASRRDLLHTGRLAEAAKRAYRLLCNHAPETLRAAARTGWQGDAAIFSGWLEEFERVCRREGLVSESRLLLELEDGPASSQGREGRAPLLLAGFDRVLETQRSFLDSWGVWQLDTAEDAAATARFWSMADGAAEIAACVAWLRERLTENPEARLLVVSTGLEARRGELERALSNFGPISSSTSGQTSGLVSGLTSGLDFEFSLGFALGQTGLARSAVLLLRWLVEPIGEPELDWLIGAGGFAASADEEVAMAGAMRETRRRGGERLEWGIEDFARLREFQSEFTMRGWPARLLAARKSLQAEPPRQSALQWAGVAGELLETLGWPGFRPLGSVAFQARQRWERVLADAGSLGYDGGRMEFAEFVAALAEAAAGTIFAAESREARVQISGPLESAGQLAEGIWFLGADEESWPGRGQPHPLLPVGLQRETGMPHASPMADWTLAEEATARLLASAGEAIFSYARQAGGVEKRPSRLILERVGPPAELADREIAGRGDRTERFEDWTEIPFPLTQMAGGAGTLTRQSRCPFQAFATVRLAAEDWEPAEAGLNARQRGQLLHAVLHRVWGGARKAGQREGGIRTLAELLAIADLRAFAAGMVSRAMGESFDPQRRNSLPARFPARYLELEAERLTGLVTEWLEYERTRLPFTVEETEVKREVSVAGLTLRLRLDRVDVLENGGKLVVDYKTGSVGPGAWEGERPDDVQLPLYAAFAEGEGLEGLVFARVRPGETQFSGRVRDANGILLAELSARSGMVQNPLTDDQLDDWRQLIERLGEDFLAGRADVDPRAPGKTCENCHLHAVCRIYERVPLAGAAEEEDSDGTGGVDG